MDKFACVVGREYMCYEYSGHPEAERVLVTHGHVETLVRWLTEKGCEALPLDTPFQGEDGAVEEAASDSRSDP